MKLERIKVENFRTLKDFEMNLEDDMSLVIGKNNVGKTSLLEVLNKFLNVNKNAFEKEDFNIIFYNDLIKKIENDENIEDCLGIKLKLFIKYDENDNLSNVADFLTTLDENNNYIIIGFEYVILPERFESLKQDYKVFKETKKEKTCDDFLKNKYKKYFEIIRRSIKFDMETDAEDAKTFNPINDVNKIKNLISLKIIHAKRLVDNKDNNKTLSHQSYNYYETIKENVNVEKIIDEFKDKLEDTDNQLDEQYNTLFKSVIDKVNKFTDYKSNKVDIQIKSMLETANLLKSNINVLYKSQEEENKLPENYNGLGYLNLISIIFEIEILINEFASQENVADINLLFIEEPEAHTHPQMQYVFIKNIKDLLNESKKANNINLQTIITTHSAHIVSQCDFNDVKYFNKLNTEGTTCKNLKDLEKEYSSNDDEKACYRFLKQYLTLNMAEIFFADKIIFIEGDTERILLPVMMKKIDLENEDKDEIPKLLSQNISIVEVGRNSKIFDKFIDFLQIKSLIITDIDSAEMNEIIDKNGIKRKVYKKCTVENANFTTSDSLLYFYNLEFKKGAFDYLVKINEKNTILNKKDGKWVEDENGFLMIKCQMREDNGYYPRSFEDSFLAANPGYMDENFKSLVNKKILKEKPEEFYEIAEKCIDGKPTFAIDILIKSNEEYTNWNIPKYIREGLEWIRK